MFAQDFREFIFARCGNSPTTQDPAQAELTVKANKLYERISSLLGPHKKLISNYEAVTTQLEGYAVEESYKIGMRDGIELKQKLELVS